MSKGEVLLPAASSGIGSFAYFNQGQNILKTRIAAFPQTPIDLNHFAGIQNPNGEIYQTLDNVPVQQFVFPKQNPQNNIFYGFQNQNDEYTRNLVPPPFKQFSEKDKNRIKQFYKQKDQIADLAPIINELVAGKHKNVQKLNLNERPVHVNERPVNFNERPVNLNDRPLNSNERLPNTNERPTNFNKPSQFSASQNDQEVQITKEKFKVFHNNIPSNYNQNEEYFPNYLTVKNPSETPKLQMYEVTEGKDWQEQAVQQYNMRNPEYQLLEIQLPKEGQEQKFQENRDVRKQIPFNTEQFLVVPSNGQSVQINKAKVSEIKPFLPTPYLPDLSKPTIATQSEISTVYNEIAQVNRLKNEYQARDPSFFDVKEVSTHLPIVGNPFEEQFQTTTVQPVDEIDEVIVTIAPPDFSNDNRNRNNFRRRRPGHRQRTTTTTENVPVMEVYGGEKENESEEVTQRQRPLRRRPTRYRTTTTTTTERNEEVENYEIRKKNRIRTRPTAQTFEEVSMNYDQKLREKDLPSTWKPEFAERYKPRTTTERDYSEESAER